MRHNKRAGQVPAIGTYALVVGVGSSPRRVRSISLDRFGAVARVQPTMTQAWRIFSDLIPLLVIVGLVIGVAGWVAIRRNRG